MAPQCDICKAKLILPPTVSHCNFPHFSQWPHHPSGDSCQRPQLPSFPSFPLTHMICQRIWALCSKYTLSFHFSSALFLPPDQAAIIFGLGYCASLILTNLPASVPALLPPPDTAPAPHRLSPLHAAVGAVLCSEPSLGFLSQLE